MVAPVWARARAVSVPRPEEQPVMRIVLWVRVLGRDWVVIMLVAVGRSGILHNLRVWVGVVVIL